MSYSQPLGLCPREGQSDMTCPSPRRRAGPRRSPLRPFQVGSWTGGGTGNARTRGSPKQKNKKHPGVTPEAPNRGLLADTNGARFATTIPAPQQLRRCFGGQRRSPTLPPFVRTPFGLAARPSRFAPGCRTAAPARATGEAVPEAGRLGLGRAIGTRGGDRRSVAGEEGWRRRRRRTPRNHENRY